MQYLYIELMPKGKSAPDRQERRRYQLLSKLIVFAAKLIKFLSAIFLVISLLSRLKKSFSHLTSGNRYGRRQTPIRPDHNINYTERNIHSIWTKKRK